MNSPLLRTVLSLALGAGLAGCSLAPHYERPQAPVEADYPSGAAYAPVMNDKTVAAADIGWRTFFTDPVLQRLIDQALENNRDLRVAALNVEAARAQYRIQRADLLPSIDARGTGSIQRLPADLSQTGSTSMSRNYQVNGATTSWELDLFGRVRSLNDKALETYLAQDETRQAAQLSLIAEVANAYLTLRADQELLGLTQETLRTQQESYRLTKMSYDAGVATQLDLSQAEIGLLTAERNQSQYTRQLAQDRNALVLLLCQPLTGELAAQVDTAQRLDDAAMMALLPEGLPSDLLARRPDIRAAEHLIKAANANIGAARAAFFPIISLTGSAGTASSSLGGLFDAGSGAWSFAPQIVMPIFAGGSVWAGLDLSKVQKNIQIAAYEKSIQTGFREVADGLAGRGTLNQQIQAQSLLVAASQRAYDVSEQRFRKGVDSYLNVLDSQRSLYAAQQALVDVRLARLSNLVILYKALGGGWTPTDAVAATVQASRAGQGT